MLSTHLKLKALSHFLDPDTSVADNSVLPNLTERMTAIGYWLLHWTSHCLNMTAGYLVVAEWKKRTAEEEGDWSHFAKVQEGSDLKVGSDGRNLSEDIENYCSFVRTLDPSLMVRPSQLLVSVLWAALAEMEEKKAADGKGA